MKTLRSILDALRSALVKRAGLLRVLALLVSAVVMTAATPNAAEACGITDPVSCVALIFIKIFQLLTALMGWILVLEVDALIRVSQYHNFVSPGPSAVRIGWIVTRDLSNMFFIVILLIIAFGTILGSSTYHYEKNLPRLLIMAVVINFSKTICGIFIDMGQVIMLTFVNGFKEAAGGNFVNAFQINKLLALGDSAGTYTFGMVVAMMFAFILSAIAVSVVLVMLVISIFRIVMLWVLIILSPIAFLSSAIPKGGEYYGQWWKEFKKYIITGPIIAFFLWLSLASVQDAGTAGVAGEGQGFPKSSAAAAGEAGAAATIGDSKIPSEAGASSDVIMNMVIAICLMFAGLKFASESGVVGLGAAKTIRNAATKAARGVATYGAKRAAEPFMSAGGRALARVPLVGGLGRAAVLQSEKWKKERVASREKFAGTPDDLARLSPGAYARKVGGIKDPKELDRFLKAGASNPAAMAALTATTTSFNPLTGATTKKSAAKDALMNMINGGKGADAAKLMRDDKRFGDLAKNDPELLKAAYEGVQKSAALDPNLKKDVGAFEQKFVAQLMGKDSNGNVMLGNVAAEREDKLKTLAPKLTNDDVAALDEGGVEALLPFMKGGQLKKIMQDGKGDQMSGATAALAKMDSTAINKLFAENGIGAGDVSSAMYGNSAVADYVLDKSKNDAKARGEASSKDTGGALKARADARMAEALASGDSAKFVAALPDALSVGSLTASTINSDAKLQAAIKQNANQIDLNSVGRNVSVTDAGKTEAGKALASLIGDVNPDKVKNARKGGMNDHILPSASDVEAKTTQTRNDARDVYVAQAMTGALAAAVAGQVSQLRGVGADDQAEALNKKFEAVTASMEKLKQTQDQLAQAEKRLTNTAGMSVDQLGALQGAAGSLKKQVEDLKSSVAQATAEVKGEKFDTGQKNRGNRRP
jgi:hypothetical protein